MREDNNFGVGRVMRVPKRLLADEADDNLKKLN